MFQSTKTYGHEVGLSCCFRQHKATHSHCSKLHGYAISVKLTFQAEELDERNWVVDFGGLKEVKQFLIDTFDHKWILAEDDPLLVESGADWEIFHHLLRSVTDVVILPHVGCEAFAKYIFGFVSNWLENLNQSNDPQLLSVEVREHGANSAIYINPHLSQK